MPRNFQQPLDEEARLLKALHELSASAGRALDPGELVKLAALRACELLHGDAVALFTWDEYAGVLVPAYTNDDRSPLDDRPLRLGEGAAGLAMQRRQAVVVTDYQHWEHGLAGFKERHLQAAEAVPLLVADRAIGALVVRFYQPHQISDQEEEILELLAAQVAPALEAARLYARSDVERERESVLREITQALAANLDERRVLDLAVEYACRLLESPYGRVWLLTPNGELKCAAAEGFVHAETFTRRLAWDSASGRAAHQHIVSLENAPEDPGWTFNREFGQRTGMGAYLGAGLWRAGESLGVIEVMRLAGHRFDLSEEQVLASLANAVAVAVSNARIHGAVEQLAREAEQRAAALAESERQLRERDAILEAVASAAERLLRANDWEQGIDDVLSQLGNATGVSRVYIVPSYDESASRRHEWTAEGTAPRAEAPSATPYLHAAGLSSWEPTLRAGSIIQGPRRAFERPEQQALASQGVLSIVVVPIFAGQSWWGFIAFDDCRQEREWAGGVVEVLRAAAGTLGAAIERRWAEAERLQLVREQAARAEAEAAQRRQTLLAEASHILASSLENESTLHGLANLVVPAVADWCAIDVRGADGVVRRMAQVPREVADEVPVADAVYPVARVLSSGEPLLFNELPRDIVRQLGVDCDFTTGLLVPLVTRAGIAGVITCLGRSSRPPFETRDLNLAQDLARRCSMAIDNSQLYREAREAISIRDEFLSVAAHELKTPMTSLRGYAQLLGRELERGDVPNPERAHRAAVTIQVQADKLARLVAQLLDISRIQSGRLAIERRSTDLSQLVRDVIESSRTQLEEHTVVVRLPDAQVVDVDPLRLEQVLRNLLDNAIKYSPDGGQIDVALDASANQVELSVRDRGVGVPLEHRAHIFDRFYQAHAGGPLTNMAGMGLGLYISRQIVELHGGDIKAEFPDDGGTRFVVTLPMWG